DRGVRGAARGGETSGEEASGEEGVGPGTESRSSGQRNRRSHRTVWSFRFLSGREGADSRERDRNRSRDGLEAPLQARGHLAGGDHRHRRVEKDPTFGYWRGKSRGARLARGVEEDSGEARWERLRDLRGSTEGQKAAVALARLNNLDKSARLMRTTY